MRPAAAPTRSREKLPSSFDNRTTEHWLVSTEPCGPRHKTLYIDDVVLTKSDYAELGRLTETERSRLLGARAWNEIA